MRHLFTSVFVYLLATNLLLAQPQSAQIKYLNPETFTVNDGLSQGYISGITQDHFGFMWLGTFNGLNRYDGYKTTTYTHDPDDSNSISGDNITTVLTDSKNRLWVGTYADGLNLFDYEKESFIHFRHDKNKSHSLSDDRIISIQEDALGAIWVATWNGLNKIITSDNLIANADKNAKTSSLSSHQFSIKCIQLDSSGKELFYFRTTNDKSWFEPSFFIDIKGFVFVRAEAGYFCIHPSINRNDTIIKLDNLKCNPGEESRFSALGLLIQSKIERTEFLFQVAKRSVAEIDPYTGMVSFMTAFTPSLMRNHSSVPFSNGNLWFEFDFHLYQYNPAGEQVVELKPYEANTQAPFQFSPSIYRDRTGITWAGTGGYGALMFKPLAEKFHRVQSSSIRWFYSSASDTVIINDGGSFYLLQKSVSVPGLLNWQKKSDFFKDIYRQLNGRPLNLAIHDANGTLWLQAEAIDRYNIQRKHLEAVVTSPVICYALYEEKNQLWYGHKDTLCKINGTSLKQTKYAIPVKVASQNFQVESIFKDSEQTLWLGTTEGLFRFDEQQQQWKQYSFRANDISSLSSNFIFSICADRDNSYLWLGTNGSGFNLFNKLTGQCKRYNTKDGLPNNVVYGILTDDANNLWMSTNRGVSNFNTVTKEFRNYTSVDGLQGNEFNRHAYCKAKDGTLFFGGVNGYNYFNPEEINTTRQNQQVVITDIKSNGKSIDFRANKSPLSTPAYLTKKIVLNFAQNSISFDFSTMDFTAGGNEKYLCFLEGIDKDWVSASTNHSPVYSNLQPGSYIFKVKAKNAAENTNMEDYALITVIILPPWYMTWWFTTLIIVFILAFLYFFYKYNLNQKIKLYKEHQRIATDLHDEIGSTLSSVHIYSEVAQSKMKTKPHDAETYLKQISSSVENTIESLGDIVWMLKTKNDRFEDIANRMRAAAVSMCEANGYNLQLHFDEHLNELKMAMETRKNIFLIYKEAINNVMKYAGGKNLFINLCLTNKEITLSIKDDGKGFYTTGEISGNGLGNMQKRAKVLNGKLEIISGPGKGTNIILKFHASYA